MCLIMYSPNAAMPDRDLFKQANDDNPHGIGVMSARGVERFNGKRKCRRAWNAAAALAVAGVPFAVHFRFATHGQPSARLTHPFASAEGVLVMHNGIISATANRSATWNKSHAIEEEHSDTSMFVADYMHTIPRSTDAIYPAWSNLIEYAIGYGSKLCTFDPRTNEFALFNESAGYWEDDGIWYSNLHSHARYAYAGMGEPVAMYSYGRDQWRGMSPAGKQALMLPASADVGSGAMSAAMCDVGSNRFANSDEIVQTFDNWEAEALAKHDAIAAELETTCLGCGAELFVNEYDARQCKDCAMHERNMRDPREPRTLAEAMREGYAKRGNGRTS